MSGLKPWAAMVLAGLALLAACEKAAAPPPMVPEVLVEAARQESVPVYQEWVGTMTGYINAVIRPQVKGYLLSKNYDEGSVVQPNQLLFQIDPREFQAQVDQWAGQLAQVKAALVKTQLDVARYTPLAAEGAVSQQELDNAIQANQANLAAVQSAEASLEQARLNLGWTKVMSPISGVAGIAVAQIGDLVDPATELTTVSQLDPIKVAFPLSESDYLRFAKERGREPASERAARDDDLELILADGSVYPERGRLSVVGRQVDVRTGTLIIEALFSNGQNMLRPGGYAKVRAVIERRPDAIVVPQRAVQDMQGQYQVAVVADGKAEWRNVTVGPRSGQDWVIERGLAKGDTVVVEGLQKIRSGMAVVARPFAAATPAPAPAG